MTLTTLELALLVAIAESERNAVNGDIPQNSDETMGWAAAVLETRSDGGIASSLIKKGFVVVQKDSDGDIIFLTDAGFDLYASLTA